MTPAVGASQAWWLAGQRGAGSSVEVLRIAISGAHSTGKTTFAARLHQTLKQAGFRASLLGTPALAARDRGLPIWRQQTLAATAWIVMRGISDELVAANRTRILVVDQPVMDALAYDAAAHTWRREPVDATGAAVLASLVGLHARGYDLVLRSVIDPAYGIQDDGDGDSDPEFRRLVDEAITSVHARLSIPAVPLCSVGHDDVMQRVLRLAFQRVGCPAPLPAGFVRPSET